VANALEVVTSGLLLALMSSDRCVPCSSGQVLSILVRNVLTCAVLITLGEPKVDDKYLVSGRFRGANEEVIRFHITVDDPLSMNLLEVMHELYSDQKNGFQIDRTFARLE